ncbi:MAG: methyltransferase domain-containing protein [Candidatus Lernaella stagnicola]|nr:methyltransferase domain-containing protein [Candidatus Lernaella stagnicola]
MQLAEAKRAEIAYRRDHYWNAGQAAERLRLLLPERRAFFTPLALAGRLKPPVLEIGAEFGLNSMILENDFGLTTVSLDLSRRSLQASTIVARVLGMDAPTPLVAADAERLPFQQASFGTVILWGTLAHFADPTTLLAEAGRVLAEDGTLVVADTPIRRRLQWPIWRAPKVEHVYGWRRWLLKLGILPFVARIGGKEEVEQGVVLHEWSPEDFEALFTGYQNRRVMYRPLWPSGGLTAGPLARALWSGRDLVDQFGGIAAATMTKPMPLRRVGRDHWVAKKHPRHDRMALRGFSGAFMCEGVPLTATDESVSLPPSTVGRSTIVLQIPRDFMRIDFWDSNDETELTSHFPAQPPRIDPLASLACPECVQFTDRCVFGFCNTECIAACPHDALEPTHASLPVKTSCDGCGACLRACPYGGLDRPPIREDRCVECRHEIVANDYIVEARPRHLRESLDLANLERVVLF